jgi:DNA-binding XRE family transcriptional regulator
MDQGRTDELGNKEFLVFVTGGPMKVLRHQRRKNPFFQEPRLKKPVVLDSTSFEELVGELKQFRLSAKLTQAQLGKLLGSNQAAISKFEQGSTNPTISFLLNFAKALKFKLTFGIKK